MGEGDLPFAYFDAICGSDEEAASLEFDVNAKRRFNQKVSEVAHG